MIVVRCEGGPLRDMTVAFPPQNAVVKQVTEQLHYQAKKNKSNSKAAAELLEAAITAGTENTTSMVVDL